MKKISFVTLMSLLLLTCFSTENLNAQNNKTDKNGLRQGEWVDYHENGNIRYKGQFKDNEPIGIFEYYNPEGKIIAKGQYLNKKKDGQWQYFSDKDGSLILTEDYQNGTLNGKAVVYIPGTDVVSEVTNYVNGVKNGEYTNYYDNGTLKMKTNYKNDALDGDYVYYYYNGVVKEEGRFTEGMKIGEWKTYDIEGNVVSTDNHEEENYNAPELKGVELK